MTFEIGVAEKESSANLPFVEIGQRGNVRADGDLNKRRIYDLSELFCAPQVRYRSSNCCIFEMKHATVIKTCTKIYFLFSFNLV